MNGDEAWESITILAAVSGPALRKMSDQDGARGDWEGQRDRPPSEAPWPAHQDPILTFLLAKAEVAVESGEPVEDVMRDLAVHAWFEGGVENYDRGQRDARRPRPV